jgi:F0F1-type ATP synthase membrane subunit b/b'
MMQETDAEDALDSAVHRLERAATLLESRLQGLLHTAAAAAGGMFDEDRAKLADELDAARGRERDLKAAGEDAARALDRAITEIRAVLGETAPDEAMLGENADEEA